MEEYMKKILYWSMGTLLTLLMLLFSPIQTPKAKERTTYDISKGDIVITKSGDYNLIGTTTKYRVTIKAGVKVNLWLKNVCIDVSNSPFTLEEKSAVNLIVSGTNRLKSLYSYYDYNGINYNGIELKKGAKLCISKYSSGTLEVYANGSGNGIGGEGSFYMYGGTLKAYGGIYGAGIGNILEPSALRVFIHGGMIYAYGGIDTTQLDTWIYYEYKNQYSNVSIYDICTDRLQITGGMVVAADLSSKAVNQSGKKLTAFAFPCKSGKISKIVIDKKSYGSTGMVSKGYLLLYSDTADKIEVTYKNGAKDLIRSGRSQSVKTNYVKDQVFDIGEGSLEIYDDFCIYDDQFYRFYDRTQQNFKVTGTTNIHRIIAEGSATLIFDSVSVTANDIAYPFLTIGNSENINIILSGKNKVQTNGTNSAILVGHNSNLSIMSESIENTLEFNLSGEAKGINLESSSLVQSGGKIVINTKDNSKGLYLGNGTSYTLYHGEFESHDDEGKGIESLTYSTVKVCGGSLTATLMGSVDEGNEVIPDISTLVITGGKVTVKNRLIYDNFYVYGGELNAHIMGAGSGTDLIQYGGNIVIDRFVTNFHLRDELDIRSYTYDFKTGQMEGSAIDQEYLFGGTITETKDVTNEELKAISYGRG